MEKRVGPEIIILSRAKKEEDLSLSPTPMENFLSQWLYWVNENSPLAEEWLEVTVGRRREGVLYLVEYARRKTSKNRRDRAWGAVSEALEVEVRWPYTLTGVRSAPLRIAIAVQRKYKDSWYLTGKQAFRYRGERPSYPSR